MNNGSVSASPCYRSAPSATGSLCDYEFEGPSAEDAEAIAELIASCPPLDPNSLYCNLLQATHFSGTCIKAERGGRLDGWISGYRPPDDPEAMFVWQVAVHERARGQGLGATMLDTLFSRPAVVGARRLITTVTPSNGASRCLFAAFARKRRANIDVRPWFDRERHFGGRHESEELISIGPF
ncbi:diaminobutyrate acetyltransferase [Novosphingobium album (ex Liu et al. 2023)]|uniref:L-2,4-diaminobutyric acid acetyltransferase n=1 Tax=Novosphingobium album (ex Liu et al. 2023) TaxID=3031130 RepID=A0ABT5WY38_9SPHN|nr:diaminobutyrate acetyltransferase [Novosphingobium album (ex Liu et al. 2023)]MDE8654691.1 diaminobutyrate acetyltransferase [Novosphingobium album (ex Liu et al. 2023)]